MKKLSIKPKTIKKLINVFIVIISLLFAIILFNQYKMANKLKGEYHNLYSSLQQSQVNKDNINSEIEKYNSIIEDKTMLSDYAEHNEYFCTDEVYIISKK